MVCCSRMLWQPSWFHMSRQCHQQCTPTQSLPVLREPHMQKQSAYLFNASHTKQVEPKTSNYDSSGSYTNQCRLCLMSIPCVSWSKQFFTSYLIVASLQKYDHEGLIQAVSTDQYMLTCGCSTLVRSVVIQWFLMLVTLVNS